MKVAKNQVDVLQSCETSGRSVFCLRNAVPKPLVWLCAIAVVFSACSSTDLSDAVTAYRAGDLAVAAEAINDVDTDDDTDGVWIQMEKGSILKAAGQIRESQAALSECQERMDALLKNAAEEGIAVGGLAGVGAVLTDDRSCTYVGALYEAQLVCALQAMNSLLSSNIVEAQAAVARLRNRVDEASEMKSRANAQVEKMRKENEKEREATAKKHGNNFKIDKSLELAAASGALPAAYGSWADTYVGIGLYMAEVVSRESGRSGEFFSYMSRAADAADKQSWKSDSYRALGRGLRAAVDDLKSESPRNTTYVIVESGLIPHRQLNTERMKKIEGVSGLDVDLPGLSAASYAGKASVSAGGKSHSTHLVCDMALLKGNEFAMFYPDIEYRAVLGKAIKEAIKIAGAATAAASDSKEGKWIGIGLMLVGGVSSALQGADLRSWDCLPFTYSVAAFPTPNDGNLTVTVDEAKADIRVVPGKSNIVIATSVNPRHCAVKSAPLQASAAPVRN